MNTFEMLPKIKEFIQKHRTWVIWGTAVILISIILIVILVAKKREQLPPLTLVEVPLQNDDTHTVVIGKDIIENEEFPRELEVYKLVSKNYHSVVDTLLSRLGKASLQKKAVQTVLYTWTKGENYVEYVPNLQSLYFKFESGANTGLDIRTLDVDGAKTYLEEFFDSLLGRNYQYMNVAVTQNGNEFRIEGNRVVNGYPLYLRGHDTYSDYLIVDRNGKLLQGKILLAEITSDESEEIALVHISNLQGALADSQYPKEVFQGYNERIADLVKDDLPISKDGTVEGDVTEISAAFPIATSSVVDTAQLVYYFSDMTMTHLAPVYRLESEGYVIYSGERLLMPITIYANALDPDRVYVPEQ